MFLYIFLQVHKIIGFAPVLLQVVMEEHIDMPVRQAGKISFDHSQQGKKNFFTLNKVGCGI